MFSPAMAKRWRLAAMASALAAAPAGAAPEYSAAERAILSSALIDTAMKLLRRSIATLALLAAAPLLANDFPTVERVLYVQDCMRTNPGPHYEMVNKCSCALDALANQVKFDDYSTMVTVVNAMSIGGERGGTLRDNETIKPQIRRYRELQAKVNLACFIAPR